MEENKQKETKLPNTSDRVVKYFTARKQGKNKTEASIVAGYADPNHTTRIEQTKQYQALQRYFKDELLTHITVNELAEELAKNIKQDNDRGAKNQAIKIALEKMEPDNKIQEDDSCKVVMVFKSPENEEKG